jgi:hypothetical protein
MSTQASPKFSFYENDIVSSMSYWEAGGSTAHLGQENVQWDGSLEHLFIQKYLSLFYAGREAWFDY